MATAIITGGSRGFGRALAQALAEDGWSVVVDGRDAGRLHETVGRIDGDVRAVPGDVTDPRHRVALLAAAGGGLDLLVHNAGALGPSPLPRLAELAPQALRDLFHVNVVAPLELTQLALPALRDSSAGTVVAITSDAATEAHPGWGAYGASKAALERLAAVLAVEEPALAVYAVDPGDLRTDMHQAAFPGEDISDRPLPEEVAPDLVALLRQRPASGRYRLAAVGAEVGA